MSQGVIAVFKNEGDLMSAAKAAREKMKYTKYDTFTPYPVHGMDDAMGLKRSWLPYVTFGAGLFGCVFALALQIWTSAYDWPLNIGGKPFVSLPAFIPITFELTVLIGGLTTVAVMFLACGLPSNKKVLHEGVTNNKFVIFVPSTEKNYNESEAKSFLNQFHPEEVKVVTE